MTNDMKIPKSVGVQIQIEEKQIEKQRLITQINAKETEIQNLIAKRMEAEFEEKKVKLEEMKKSINQPNLVVPR